MKKEYYRMVANYTPSYCSTITYTVAISEPVEIFFNRNPEQYGNLAIVMCQPCTKEEYLLYKRFNPTNESYIKLKREDYGKFIR